MFEPRTHFEQVPLEVVKKIVEEQLQQNTTEPSQGTVKNTPEEALVGASEHFTSKQRKERP